MRSDTLAKYDREQSYRWNYDNAPESAPNVDVPQVPGDWSFCGLPVDSPARRPRRSIC